MARIRREILRGNQGGRTGCQVQHDLSAAIFYVTIEEDAKTRLKYVVAKDFWKREIGRDTDPVTIAGTDTSADFEFPYLPNPGRLIVTVEGYTPEEHDSASETFMFDVRI